MITEDYVSFEVAKLLKEKGFKILTYKVYDNQNELDDQCAVCWVEKRLPYISAPTLQMAVKWLMEFHNIFISVGLDIFSKMYFATVYNQLDCATPNPRYGTDLFKTPKEAFETAIKYSLENLI